MGSNTNNSVFIALLQGWFHLLDDLNFSFIIEVKSKMFDPYLPQTLIKTETAGKRQCKQFVHGFISVLIPSGHIIDDLHESVDIDIK